MIMFMGKILADIGITKKRAKRTGLRIFPIFLALTLAGCYPAPYREVSSPASIGTTPPTQLTQVYFYPKAGQTTEQQSRDHYECYNWAVQQTGFDPSRASVPIERRISVVPVPPPGYDTTVLAITGAVLGAIIAGPRNSGGGALIGAAGGAVLGAASDISRQQTARQLEETYSARDRAADAQYEAKAFNFKRAMSACLEGRGYTVQ